MNLDAGSESLIADLYWSCHVYCYNLEKPNIIVSEKSDVLQKPKLLNRLLTHLMKLKILSNVQCGNITEQFTELIDY